MNWDELHDFFLDISGASPPLMKPSPKYMELSVSSWGNYPMSSSMFFDGVFSPNKTHPAIYWGTTVTSGKPPYGVVAVVAVRAVLADPEDLQLVLKRPSRGFVFP